MSAFTRGDPSELWKWLQERTDWRIRIWSSLHMVSKVAALVLPCYRRSARAIRSGSLIRLATAAAHFNICQFARTSC